MKTSKRIKAIQTDMSDYAETKDGHPVFEIKSLCRLCGIDEPTKEQEEEIMRHAYEFANRTGLKHPIFVSRNES